MLRTRQILASILSVTALTFMSVAGAQGAAAASSGGNVTVALAGDAVCLLPYNTNDNLSFGIEANIYQGLIGYNAQMKLIPELAQRWVAASNAKSVTFYLNPKATFSDGTQVTAQDVKQSFEFLLNPKNNLVRTALYSPITQIHVLAKETIQFVLAKPFGAMLPTFAHPAGAVVEPSALAHGVKYLCAHPIGGSGPFVFKDWVPGDHLTVVKNPNYWDPANAAKVASITYRPVTDASARISGLETGQYQVVYPIPTQMVASLKKTQGVKISTGSNILTQWVSMNTQLKPFNNVKVRQALNFAINRKAIINVIWNGFGTYSHSPLAQGVAYYHYVGTYNYNVAYAKKLLKEAGYPHGFTANLWLSNSSENIELGTAVQQQLALIGVKINVQPMDSASLDSAIFSTTAKTKMQMLLAGWSPSTGDADWGLRPLLATSSWPPALFNTAFFSNAQFDSLLQQGLSSASPAVRGAAYLTAQQIAWHEAPWIFLGIPTNIWGERSNIKGAAVRPDAVLLMYNVSE